MTRQEIIEIIEPYSLEDYIVMVDSPLTENNSHFIFFKYSFDQLREEEKMVRDATMFNMLMHFKEAGLLEKKVEYAMFLNEIIDSMSYMVLKTISEGMDMMEKIGGIASSEPRNIPTNAINIGEVSGEGAGLLRKIEVMAYAIQGYKTIKDSISDCDMNNTKPKYN